MARLYFSSARCNPSDRLNRHGRGGCSYVERQKPGNDFDKVTARRPTTRRIKKKLLIAGVSPSFERSRARALAPESLYRQHSDARSTRFSGAVQSWWTRASWCCKEQRSGVTVAVGALVSRIYEKHTPCLRALLPATSSRCSHSSSSGDPYPTNFQIINISVAALLRAS